MPVLKFEQELPGPVRREFLTPQAERGKVKAGAKQRSLRLGNVGHLVKGLGAPAVDPGEQLSCPEGFAPTLSE